ncbi:MAG: diphthine-ammonia ligase [Thermoplasmata archaeon]|nr:diphthine-ammonia ligase [Thermoplasmata archaeon]
MRVLALLSGGKDSVAAVEVAQGHGWDVVAALTMVPAEDDAWMFHTPNLGVVRGVAECLGLPLLEAPCRSGQQEEVAGLEAAIARVQRDLNLDGVVSGALASEYQRTRIDAIGHRLGLKTFAPLWHKEPRAYVRSLLAGGYGIRFSRTAAEGVPNAWAGQPLDVAKLEAMERHPAGPHPAGEGGEYETLVVAAPHYKGSLECVGHVEATASRATWVVDSWRVAR